jgi:hypothetical protein
MALLGVLFYAKHLQAPRTRLLGSMFILGAVLFALGGPVPFTVLVPIAYLFVVAGIAYLLHEWLSVFPRNPLARSLGYGVLALAVTLSCTYNLRAYFIAWPHSRTTVTTFHVRP